MNIPDLFDVTNYEYNIYFRIISIHNLYYTFWSYIYYTSIQKRNKLNTHTTTLSDIRDNFTIKISNSVYSYKSHTGAYLGGKVVGLNPQKIKNMISTKNKISI